MPSTKANRQRTPAQSRAIWALVTGLKNQGLSQDDAEEVLRAAVRQVSGQDSTRQLTVDEAGQVCDRLQQLVHPRPQQRAESAPHAPWGRRGPGPRQDQTITRVQQQTLELLFRQANMTTLDRQRAFSVRQCKLPWPQSQKDCDKIFEALKAMILRPHTGADWLARAEALVGRPELADGWKDGFVVDAVEGLRGRGKRWLTTHRLSKLLECEQACGVAS